MLSYLTSLNKFLALSHPLRCVFCEEKREAGELYCRSTDSWAYLPHTSGESGRKNETHLVVDVVVVACLQPNVTMWYLQDFYSHSNWVELENKAPYSVLIQPDRPLEKLAGRNFVPAQLD